MTLKKVKLLHGLVIRVSGDSGEQIGAHVEYVERIIDTKTGAVESAKMLPPERLEPGADALTPLIGEVVRVQQAELDQLRALTLTLQHDLDAEKRGRQDDAGEAAAEQRRAAQREAAAAEALGEARQAHEEAAAMAAAQAAGLWAEVTQLKAQIGDGQGEVQEQQTESADQRGGASVVNKS